MVGISRYVAGVGGGGGVESKINSRWVTWDKKKNIKIARQFCLLNTTGGNIN